MAVHGRRFASANVLMGAVTALLVGWGAVLGTINSVLLYGAALSSLVLLLLGRIALPRRAEVRWVAAAFGLYFLAHAVSTIVNPWSWRSAKQLAEVIPFLGALPLQAGLASVRRDTLTAWLETGIVTGAFATLGVALVDIVVLGLGRAEGGAGNAGPFAVIAAGLYGASLFVAARREGRGRWAAGAACLSAAVALLLSGIRSLWPMLLLAPLILASLSTAPRRLWWSALLGLAAMVVVALAVEVTLGVITPRLEQALADTRAIRERGDHDNSIGRRLRLWDAGLQIAAEKPVFGHGSGELKLLIEQRTALEGLPLDFNHLHNFVLDATARIGLVGLAVLVVILGLPVHLGKRRSRDGSAEFGYAALLVVQASFILSGMVGLMLGHDVLDAFLLYATVAACALMFPERTEPARSAGGA